ncbi:hypothetical protein I552_6560 [Mycobacterium xenopi 3993]|nr:hypothetical protein I552_6560 [Mycobacterium xenopi 3993]
MLHRVERSSDDSQYFGDDRAWSADSGQASLRDMTAAPRRCHPNRPKSRPRTCQRTISDSASPSSGTVSTGTTSARSRPFPPIQRRSP